MEDLDLGGRILKYIFDEYDGIAWTVFVWLGIWTNKMLVWT